MFDGLYSLTFFGELFFSGLSDFTLVSIPMFIAMGAAVASSPAGADLYGALERWLTRIPGGLAISNIGASGEDGMPSGAVVGIDLDLDCNPDQSFVLRGPMTVSRSSPHDVSIQFPGVGVDDGHPDVIEAQSRVIEACRRHGKFPGLGGVYEAALMARYIDMGMRFILCGNDLTMMMTAARERAASLRELTVG